VTQGGSHTAQTADEKLAVQLPELPRLAIHFPASPRENHANSARELQLFAANFSPHATKS
jgi:hypothetical protein